MGVLLPYLVQLQKSPSITSASSSSSLASHRGQPRCKRWAVRLHLLMGQMSKNLCLPVTSSKHTILKSSLWDSFPILHSPSLNCHHCSLSKVCWPFQWHLPASHFPPHLPHPLKLDSQAQNHSRLRNIRPRCQQVWEPDTGWPLCLLSSTPPQAWRQSRSYPLAHVLPNQALLTSQITGMHPLCQEQPHPHLLLPPSGHLSDPLLGNLL